MPKKRNFCSIFLQRAYGISFSRLYFMFPEIFIAIASEAQVYFFFQKDVPLIRKKYWRPLFSERT